MGYEQFITEVRDRGGLTTDLLAERVTLAVLSVLGQRLVEVEKRAVAENLSPRLAEILMRAMHDADFDVPELVARVRRALGEPEGVALEQVMVVCQVLAAHVDDAGRRRLEQLPPDFATLFERPAGPDVVDPSPQHGRKGTLATGRPGSRRAVSSSRPPPAQAESVVVADNPHADTKLSSGHGTEAERRGDVIAEGTAGSHDGLSDGRD